MVTSSPNFFSFSSFHWQVFNISAFTFSDYTICMEYCVICHKFGPELCEEHNNYYMFDKSINGYRLRKTCTGSRYTDKPFHKNEIKLTKILEDYFGKSNIVTSFHPLWAVSKKGVLLEFDIYIKSLNVLIEYNGIQHYEYTKFFQKNYKEFRKQVSRDKLKVKLAKKNKFNLIVFTSEEPMVKSYILNKIKAGQNGSNS